MLNTVLITSERIYEFYFPTLAIDTERWNPGKCSELTSEFFFHCSRSTSGFPSCPVIFVYSIYFAKEFRWFEEENWMTLYYARTEIYIYFLFPIFSFEAMILLSLHLMVIFLLFFSRERAFFSVKYRHASCSDLIFYKLKNVLCNAENIVFFIFEKWFFFFVDFYGQRVLTWNFHGYWKIRLHFWISKSHTADWIF